MNVRNLLRKLIGWDELDTRFAPADEPSKLLSHINALRAEIRELKEARPKPAERKGYKIPDTWEQVVAQFAENPEHYKEQS